VPQGIIYKAASPEANKKAEANLRQALAKAPYDFMGLMPADGTSMTIAGMFLTIQTLKAHDKELQGLIPAKFHIPFGKDVNATIDGYAAREPDQVKKLAKVLSEVVKLDAGYKIRRLTPDEMAVAWYNISWDMNEPLMIAEDTKHKYLFGFYPDGETLFWVDDMTKPCFTMGTDKHEALTPCMCYTTEHKGLQYQVGFKQCKG
jgi:hypothetical protein